MKDKLVKTHKKGAFFYFKKIGFCFSIFMGATVCVAIPLSIATIVRTNEENKKQEENKDLNDKTDVKELLTF